MLRRHVSLRRAGRALQRVALATVCGCAAPAPVAAPATVVAAPNVEAVAQEPPVESAHPDDAERPPRTWDEALDRYASTCPAPFFTLASPRSVSIGPRAFAHTGSTMTLQGGPWQGPLRLGVLGAIKDADAATRANIKRAMAAFKKAGVHAVIANGDLTGNEASALLPVVQMLGQEVDLPLLAHAGNYEWTSAFTTAFGESAAAWPQLVNMNIVRDVDFGGIHVVSLPGYFNRRFLQSGACHYSDTDVDALLAHVQPLKARGEIVVLTSHGPPLGSGRAALDVTHDGENVGDPRLTTLLTTGGVAFGIFSHILEAGGRAVTDAAGTAPVRLPMRDSAAGAASLYVNVGTASSFGWSMLGGKTAHGMAAIYTVDASLPGGAARVVFVPLD